MAGVRPFRVLTEGERGWGQERVREWEERLRRMRAVSLRLEGETGARYRQILKDLVVKEQEFLTRWEQVRSRLYVAEEEWRGLLEALETLERTYEEVRGQVEPLFPSEAQEGLAA